MKFLKFSVVIFPILLLCIGNYGFIYSNIDMDHRDTAIFIAMATIIASFFAGINAKSNFE